MRRKITVDDADEKWLNFIINLLNLNRSEASSEISDSWGKKIKREREKIIDKICEKFKNKYFKWFLQHINKRQLNQEKYWAAG